MEPITADCSLRFLIKSTDLSTWLTIASEFETELCNISEPFLAVCAVDTADSYAIAAASVTALLFLIRAVIFDANLIILITLPLLSKIGL